MYILKFRVYEKFNVVEYIFVFIMCIEGFVIGNLIVGVFIVIFVIVDDDRKCIGCYFIVNDYVKLFFWKNFE